MDLLTNISITNILNISFVFIFLFGVLFAFRSNNILALIGSLILVIGFKVFFNIMLDKDSLNAPIRETLFHIQNSKTTQDSKTIEELANSKNKINDYYPYLIFVVLILPFIYFIFGKFYVERRYTTLMRERFSQKEEENISRTTQNSEEVKEEILKKINGKQNDDKISFAEKNDNNAKIDLNLDSDSNKKRKISI